MKRCNGIWVSLLLSMCCSAVVLGMTGCIGDWISSVAGSSTTDQQDTSWWEQFRGDVGNWWDQVF